MKTRRFSTFALACLAAVLVLSVGPVSSAPAQADPVMTSELMARLIIFARGGEELGGVSGEICKILDLCDGTKALPMKIVGKNVEGTNHWFGISLDADAKHIIFGWQRNGIMEIFLTDKTRTLRAAAVFGTKPGDVHLITNEKAAVQFRAELGLFAKEAAALPPTGQ